MARRNVYVNSITTERSKWLEKIRTNVAEHTGVIGRIYTAVIISESKGESRSQTGERIAADLADLMRIQSLIKLQLNPRGLIDKNIIQILDAMTLFVPEASEAVSDLDVVLIRHFQFLLKDEWEKVKLEAGGFWRNITELFRAKRRSKEYERFAVGEGAYAKLLEKVQEVRVQHFGNQL